MLAILLSIFLAAPVEAAPTGGRDDFARRQRLQASARAWFNREVAPYISGRSSLRVIHSFSVSVKENSHPLPPDLGGPRPGSPVEVLVQVYISGLADDHYWGRRSVECRIFQKLLAKNNGKGLPESIRPNQPLRAPLACASGIGPEDNWGRPHPHHPWRR